MTRARAVIGAVNPQVDGGRYPAKHLAGDPLRVTAEVFTDGHDLVAAVARLRGTSEAEIDLIGSSDTFSGDFAVSAPGHYELTIIAWVDRYATWLRDSTKRSTAQKLLPVHCAEGIALFEQAAPNAPAHARERLLFAAQRLRAQELPDTSLSPLMRAYLPRLHLTTSPWLPLYVERERAGSGAWYELFPRSHGGLRGVTALVPGIAKAGFDVLYVPPIHPIGREHRKGKNNTLTHTPEDVGSPWAIGSREGGHHAIHPELGTLEDFRALVKVCSEHHMELALDLAFQCAPDHPWVHEHPQWFRHRPDGSIACAENPPKVYEDIYPFDFECDDWQALWQALADVAIYWAAEGVRIFRVDNPHTKPFAFWEQCLRNVREKFPDTVFLAEAFSRPSHMHQLAKIGFSQSYTYFTWRTDKRELEAYATELTTAPVKDFFRANFWPNTPDILPYTLQSGARAAFVARVILAATLSASYGIYGPAYENLDHEPLRPGGEEYRDSEKFEVRAWPEGPLRPLLTLLNQLRRQHRALQRNASLRFHATTNEQLICYSKEASGERVVVVVNLDPYHVQSGEIDLGEALVQHQAHDLLSGARYLWNGARHFIQLDPQAMPAHIFVLRHHLRTERDFDYFA